MFKPLYISPPTDWLVSLTNTQLWLSPAPTALTSFTPICGFISGCSNYA